MEQCRYTQDIYQLKNIRKHRGSIELFLLYIFQVSGCIYDFKVSFPPENFSRVEGNGSPMREIWLWLEFVHKPPPLAPPTGGPPIAFYSGFYCFMGISPENDWSVLLRFTLTTQLLRNFR